MKGLFIYLAAVGGSPVIEAMEAMRRSLVNGKLSAFGSLAGVVAGLLCAVVLLKLAHDYLEGQGITLWQVIRPLVILVLCCNFNTFVAGPLHSVCNLVTRGMSNQCSVSWAQYKTAMGNHLKVQLASSAIKSQMELEEARQETMANFASVGQPTESGEKKSFWRKIGDSFEAGLKSLISFGVHGGAALLNQIDFRISGVLTMAVELLLLFIMKVVLLGQQISCYITLTILTLLGPFAFALAIVPGFSHNISSWIARYVQIALWIPIGQIVMYLNLQILGRITVMAQSYDIGSKYILIVALIVCIMQASAVPQIANYIVESSGDSGAGNKGMNSLRETFQTIASAKTMGMK